MTQRPEAVLAAYRVIGVEIIRSSFRKARSKPKAADLSDTECIECGVRWAANHKNELRVLATVASTASKLMATNPPAAKTVVTNAFISTGLRDFFKTAAGKKFREIIEAGLSGNRKQFSITLVMLLQIAPEN